MVPLVGIMLAQGSLSFASSLNDAPAVAALRDKGPQTARVPLAGLATKFPGNQLYVVELARTQ